MTYKLPHLRTDAEKDELLFGKKNNKILKGEFKPKKKSTNEESKLQTTICMWLKKEYPGLIFFSDFAAGLYLPSEYMRGLRSKQACEGKYCDLTILRAVGGYNGLTLELKVLQSDLFLVDGKTLGSNHVREQYDMILRLRKEGYASDFAVGEADIKHKIKSYLSGEFENREIIYSRSTTLY